MKTTFLDVIARQYKKRYTDLSGFTFVMPNKRSGYFLTKIFAEMSDTAMVAPRILSINEFIAEVADNVTDSRIDSIFRLYRCYLNILGCEGGMTLDTFSSWGEIILSDFNEIDMQMVNAEEIFKNVYDLNAIKSNFLTSAQKRVMAEYFGYNRLEKEEDFEHLWEKIETVMTPGEEGEESKIRGNFHSLWKLLLPLYKEFKVSLHNDGLTSAGGAYREVAEKLEEGLEPLEGEKLVFVGFNALSESEFSIFSSLKKMEISLPGRKETEPKADFIWDMVPEIFAQQDDPALKFVSFNSSKDNFPIPEWIKRPLQSSIPDKMPELKIVSVPSRVMQAKVAGEILSEMLGQQEIEEMLEDARIAVVLPDENLLLPMLYSLPKSMSHPNLTMGFPLKHTPVVSFVALLRKLQQATVVSGKDDLFYLDNVKDLLAHPYADTLFDRKDVNGFISHIEKQRRLLVSANLLKQLGGNASLVFRPLKSSETVDYLKEILSKVKDAFSEGKNKGYLRAEVERVYIGSYIDALIKLKICLNQYDFQFEPTMIFQLADRIIAGESVVFDGRPLEGLQIMGVLETRCLDFDKVIMLGVNEKVMPRVGRNSTFIPNVIRNAFGMPPANYQEEIFAYYFFRLLGRCREGILTYDSRASENRTPGPSRYLLQLKYLSPRTSVLSECEYAFNLPRRAEGEIKIEKEDWLTPYLDRYVVSREASREEYDVLNALETEEYGILMKTFKNFSASALSHYLGCGLKFLFNDVMNLAAEREQTETIDPINLGLIVHEAIQNLYFPEKKRKIVLNKPIVVTQEFLRSLLYEKVAAGEETRVEREVRLQILKHHFKDTGIDDLRGSAALIYEYVVKYVRNILEADLAQAPFRLWGCEIERTMPYYLAPDPESGEKSGKIVSIKMVIDRLDQEGAEGASRPFRIVDYKTGNDHLNASSITDIFGGDYKSRNIFQLLLYAELLLKLLKEAKIEVPGGLTYDEFEKNLKVVIYKVIQLPDLKEGLIPPKIGKMETSDGKIKDREVSTIGELRKVEEAEGVTFKEEFDRLLERILDPDTGFSGEPSDHNCVNCDFRLRCEVMLARKEEEDR